MAGKFYIRDVYGLIYLISTYAVEPKRGSSKYGCGAKNLALLRNQRKPLQLGKLISLITRKMVHKGENYSIKLQKYYFCTAI
jgi:RNA:NAD 2'-phosphotransferase (TPT1/KptA family)